VYARKVLLWGALLLGSLIAFIGAIGLIGTVIAPSSDAATRNNSIVGSIAFLVVGFGIGVPSWRALFHKRASEPIPAWLAAADSTVPATSSVPADLVDIPDAAIDGLRESYLRWFARCRSELGGDAIALHAGTMAALGASAAGDNEAGASAARALILATGQTPAIAPAKVSELADIGAATLLLLGADERVLVSFRGADQRVAALSQIALGVIGRLLAARGQNMFFVTVTDRRIIVLKGSESTGRPSSLRLAEARLTIQKARYKPGLLGNGYFTIKSASEGKLVMNVMRNWTSEVSVASQLLNAGKSQTS
jgi:hypothetical protein